MKRFLLFAVVVALFTACTQEITVDVTNPTIADDAPETLVVGFEGDDTRIQLQGGKTVWTQGDQVSVFYKSDANQKWQYNGETGSRTAELKRVDAGVASARMDRVVVAYPYSDNYLLNLTTGDIEATMPAVQTYMKDSYGLDGNIMVASSYFTQFNLKNVCGWLKLQLTGDGEVVKSIKLRGNNGEQVAGLIYVDTENATSILASEMGDVTEDEGENITGGAGGNLVFDDTILKTVTLDCGEGVTLGKSATAFYIALPPQTFTQGLTVEITDDSGYTMTQATDKEVAIERNTIQPMAAIDFVNPNTPAQPTPANNQIWYTATKKAEPNLADKYAFGADVISNSWDSETGKGIITFDGDVTMVGYQAFYNCDNFITINLPDSVTTIGNLAFHDCYSLTSVNIPDSVTTIGDLAFSYCDNLTSVNIPDSVTTIGNYAFRYCTSLTSVTIGNSVTTIGEEAFQYCDSLTSVNIPDSVTTIGNWAFSDCYSLTSVNIPDSVTTIGNYAFSYCDSLTSVTIGNSVTTIGDYAFCDCDSLTSVNIPDSVMTIGDLAFAECNSLTSVDIPDSVTTIGNATFAGCSNLREFTGKYAADGGRCLIIDNTIIAYAEASGTTYNIPESVTTIGEWAFALCISLTGVNIPDCVTTIGEYAFTWCDSLTSVNIPDSVTTIGEGAFTGCSNLKYVYCKATTPPALGYSNVFDNNASGRRIIVPIGSGEAYKTAEYWSEYANDIFEDEF